MSLEFFFGNQNVGTCPSRMVCFTIDQNKLRSCSECLLGGV